MKLISTAAAIVLASTVAANASTLTNMDKEARTVKVTVDGATTEEKIDAGQSYSSGDKAATFQIGKEKAVSAKADKNFVIKHNMIKAEKKSDKSHDAAAAKSASEAAPAAGKTEEAAPADMKNHAAEPTTPASEGTSTNQ